MSKTTKKKRRERQAEIRRAQEARRNSSDYEDRLANIRAEDERERQQSSTYKWIAILAVVVIVCVLFMYFRGNSSIFG